MRITAKVRNGEGRNDVHLDTDGRQSTLPIPAKSSGSGSSVNGGELLFLAVATCYVNDVYREAAKRKIRVRSVEVEVSGEFGAEGEGARGIAYHTHVEADADQQSILELMRQTDRVAEIHNSLRSATPVRLQTANGVVL